MNAERRRWTAQVGRRPRGRRWADDPELRQQLERLLTALSSDLFTLRERTGWSQEEAAAAAGVDPETVLALEKTSVDPRISTVMRLYFAYGRQLVMAGLPSPGSNRENRDDCRRS